MITFCSTNSHMDTLCLTTLIFLSTLNNTINRDGALTTQFFSVLLWYCLLAIRIFRIICREPIHNSTQQVVQL